MILRGTAACGVSAVVALAVSGCSSGQQAPGIVSSPSTSSSPTSASAVASTPVAQPTEAPCAADALDVSVDASTPQVDVVVKNTSRSDCPLIGDPPVAVRLGQVRQPTPVDGSVVLPAGSTYTVSFVRAEDETACPTPGSSGTPRPGVWTVVVGSTAYRPKGDGQLITNAVYCFVYDQQPAVTTP